MTTDPPPEHRRAALVVEDDDGLAEGNPETPAACFLFDPGEVDSALQYFHWPS